MLGRLLIAASFAALLTVAPGLGVQAQDQGTASQDGQVIKKKKKAIQSEGQATGDQQQLGDQGTSNKKLKKPQQTTADQPAGEEGQAVKKKKAQQTTEGMPDQEATGEQGQTAKKKKLQQTQQKQPSDQTTTGATGKIATDLTPEKKTIIREKIVTRNVTRVERDKIDFDISVGVVVPTTTIHLEPLPVDIVEVVPEYSGYLFFVLADGTIVIVEPSSYEIVFVLTA